MWSPPGSEATLDGEALDVMEDGTLLAGFGRDAAATAELVVTGEASCRQTLTIAPRNYNIQRVEGVPQKTVTPSPQHLERIRREQVLINAARAQQLPRPDLLEAALTGFEWPSDGPISGVYGKPALLQWLAGQATYTAWM